MRRVFDITDQPKYYKKQLSRKQQSALAHGRGLRTQTILNKYYEEANRGFVGPERDRLTRRKYINRLRYMVELGEAKSIKEAHELMIHTFPYISQEDNYKYQIFKYVDKNELRKRIAEATGADYKVVGKVGKKYGQVRVSGGLSLDNIENSFAYDPGTKSLVSSFTNPTTGQSTIIHIRIVEGENSNQPSFIEIY